MDRTRRLRQTAVMRSMVRENHVRTEELIYPLFVMEGENIVQPVESMPGICQYSVRPCESIADSGNSDFWNSGT